MKRYWSTEEYARAQRIRSRQAARRLRLQSAERRRRARGHLGVSTPSSKRYVVTPPAVLSVMENPEETLGFCDALRSALHRRRADVEVELREVTRISSDALLLMRAIIDDARGIFANIGGSLPNDARSAAKIKASGFFTGFSNPPKNLPAPQGLIVRKSLRKVDSQVAAELVDFALKNADVPQAMADASYKNLVELMGNTHNHAAQRERDLSARRQAWQATVYCEEGVAYFTFVDLGVGILRSPAPRGRLKDFGATLFNYGQPKLLREIFQGLVGASADVPGRGFGLQRMMSQAEAELLPELRVVTGSLVGEVVGMNFRQSGVDFLGTMFRWTTRTAAPE